VWEATCSPARPALMRAVGLPGRAGYIGEVRPYLMNLPWCDPIDGAHALLTETGALALNGRGSHPLARWSYVCAPPVAVQRLERGEPGCQPFSGLSERLARCGVEPDPEGPPFQGGWAGVLSYELGHAFERLPRAPDGSQRWPALWLGLYDTLAAFDAQTRTLTVLSAGLGSDLRPDPDLAKARALKLADRLAKAAPVVRPSSSDRAERSRLAPAEPRALTERHVARTVELICSGDIYQANISRRLHGHLPAGAAPRDFYHALMSRHPAPFGACLTIDARTGGTLALVSHTPERFLTVSRSGQVETRPIKGTRPRRTDPAADAAEAAALLASPKDRSENLMIVDLMRNDISRVCLPGTVRVPRLFGVESFSTVHHLVSDVTGRLRPRLDAFDALAAAFPPGSVTGAPKVRAMEIICELEARERGPYCGSMIRVGWDGALDSSVLIRTAACHLPPGAGGAGAPGSLWQIEVRAGGGIVVDSLPDMEVDEMDQKGRAFVETLAAMADVPGALETGPRPPLPGLAAAVLEPDR
jgi:para-aminobenzoate synthetase component I